jgi:anti-anti-sigma factor
MNSNDDEPLRHIKVSESSDVTILTLLDQQIDDVAQAEGLRNELVALVRQSAHTRFVVDMGHVIYITSIALLPFVTLRKTVNEIGGRVVLCNLSEVVAKVLTVSQLIIESRAHVRHMAMADDLESALRWLRQESGPP